MQSQVATLASAGKITLQLDYTFQMIRVVLLYVRVVCLFSMYAWIWRCM